MEDQQSPYIHKNPGDLISSEAWNQLQSLIKGDIDSRIEQAVGDIQNVPESSDSQKLSGKTAQELSDEILDRALAAIPKRTGYLKLFKVLKKGETVKIEHCLQACPLVDVYQLHHFLAVCAVDEDKMIQPVTFYLYHSSEKKIRCKGEDGNMETVEIEPTHGCAYKIPLADLLNAYEVEYTPKSSLGDLETEFWQAFFADPNDRFDPEQYCHSPWFERCCREERTVKSLKARGDWDELWVQMRPCKTINYPWPPPKDKPESLSPSPSPSQIQVCHYDWNTIGVQLLEKAVPENPPGLQNDQLLSNFRGTLEKRTKEELKVMLLLKV